MCKEVLEPFVAPEFFVDGFTNYATHDGVMTCVGYRNLPEGLTAVIKLVWPAVNTMAAVHGCVQALTMPEISSEPILLKRGAN